MTSILPKKLDTELPVKRKIIIQDPIGIYYEIKVDEHRDGLILWKV